MMTLELSPKFKSTSRKDWKKAFVVFIMLVTLTQQMFSNYNRTNRYNNIRWTFVCYIIKYNITIPSAQQKVVQPYVMSYYVNDPLLWLNDILDSCHRMYFFVLALLSRYLLLLYLSFCAYRSILLDAMCWIRVVHCKIILPFMKQAMLIFPEHLLLSPLLFFLVIFVSFHISADSSNVSCHGIF